MELYDIVNSTKKRDYKYLKELINIFNPQIKKYSRELEAEDTKQDLIVKLLEIIDRIPACEDWTDKAILYYISKSLKNEYIKISKRLCVETENKVSYGIVTEIDGEDFEHELEFIELLELLSDKESYIIKLIYCYGFSVSEVAQIMKVSRQTINSWKNNALKNLKRIYGDIL